jgi:hypothetical protein
LLHRPRTSDPSGAVASEEKPSHLIAKDMEHIPAAD